MCFATEVFHLNNKDHMVFDNLESIWNISEILQSIKCNTDILHFFCNSIHPEVDLAQRLITGIIHRIGEMKAINVCLLQVFEFLAFNQGEACILL